MAERKSSKSKPATGIEDIAMLESEFGVTLPSEYVQFLAAYPSDFVKVNEDYDQFEAVSDLYVFNSIQRLREFNGEVRDEGMEFADGKAWPKECFVIGHDGCGNYYAIQCGKSAGKVVMWDGDEQAFEEVAKNVTSFAQYVRDLIGLPSLEPRVTQISESAAATKTAARTVLDLIRSNRTKKKKSPKAAPKSKAKKDARSPKNKAPKKGKSR